MLLIDSVKYELWTPPNEDELENMVIEHAKDIFGEHSIYLDKKQKLKSLAGVGSIPDGLVIMFENVPEWHIVEVELSSHQLYDHIVNQVGRFINGVKNTVTQKKITEAIYHHIQENKQRKAEFEEAIGSGEIYKLLTDVISKSPVLTIIIEKRTRELDEALDLLRYSPIKIVEFQTFTRENVGLPVHAHIFEPLYKRVEPPPPPPIHTSAKSLEIKPHSGEIVKARKVTFEELVSAGFLVDGQVLYFYNTRLFKDERAEVIAPSNQLKYEANERTYSKSELAKILLIKHDFKHDEHGVAGPKYWKTEDGKLLRDLEEQVRSLRGDRE